jgi:hypothetical protein
MFAVGSKSQECRISAKTIALAVASAHACRSLKQTTYAREVPITGELRGELDLTEMSTSLFLLKSAAVTDMATSPICGAFCHFSPDTQKNT